MKSHSLFTKPITAVITLLVGLFITHSNGAPYWDTSIPGPPNATFGNGCAVKNGVFYKVGTYSYYPALWKWTHCDGWRCVGIIHSLGEPTTLGTIGAICVSTDYLYITGDFSSIEPPTGSSVGATNVARFNLACESWSAVGDGTTHPGTAITVDANEKVYLGGASAIDSQHGSIDPELLQTWNGTSWETVGGGLQICESCFTWNITALANDGTNVFAAGGFYGAYNGTNFVPSYAIIKWDGANWTTMVSSIGHWCVNELGDWSQPIIHSIAVSGTNVFAAGDFTGSYNENGSPQLPVGIDRYSTVSGQPLPIEGLYKDAFPLDSPGTPGVGYAVTAEAGTVYVTGLFDHVTNMAANGIAQWSAGSWSALDNGLYYQLWDSAGWGTEIAADKDNVYVYGGIDYAGGLECPSHLARWVKGVDMPCGVVRQISAGFTHTLARKSDGTVWAWGGGASGQNYGQVGDGTTINRTSPVKLSCFSSIAAVSAGLFSSYALTEDGLVKAWGYNNHGQLGNNSTANSSTPVSVVGLSNVVSISAGGYCCYAIKSDGTVWSWGWNNVGQLGDGTTTQRLAPVQVTNLVSVADIDGGGTHCLAIKSDGTVWAWGGNNAGQLGDGTTVNRPTPVQVTNLPAVSAVSAGGYHSLALGTNGQILAWGYNVYGQLGDATLTDRHTPITTITVTNVTTISAGQYHSLATTTSGTNWAWGYTFYGEIGNGMNNTPAYYQYPAATSYITNGICVSAGGNHSVSVQGDFTVKSWGRNTSGQLGDGTTTQRERPVSVSGAFGL